MTATSLRDRGVARVSENTPSDWVSRFDGVILTMASSGSEFSAEDVRLLAGDPPHPNAIGGRFLAAVRRGWITRVGYKNATRNASHARALAVYRGGN